MGWVQGIATLGSDIKTHRAMNALTVKQEQQKINTQSLNTKLAVISAAMKVGQDYGGLDTDLGRNAAASAADQLGHQDIGAKFRAMLPDPTKTAQQNQATQAALDESRSKAALTGASAAGKTLENIENVATAPFRAVSGIAKTVAALNESGAQAEESRARGKYYADLGNRPRTSSIKVVHSDGTEDIYQGQELADTDRIERIGVKSSTKPTDAGKSLLEQGKFIQDQLDRMEDNDPEKVQWKEMQTEIGRQLRKSMGLQDTSQPRGEIIQKPPRGTVVDAMTGAAPIAIGTPRSRRTAMEAVSGMETLQPKQAPTMPSPVEPGRMVGQGMSSDGSVSSQVLNPTAFQKAQQTLAKGKQRVAAISNPANVVVDTGDSVKTTPKTFSELGITDASDAEEFQKLEDLAKKKMASLDLRKITSQNLDDVKYLLGMLKKGVVDKGTGKIRKLTEDEILKALR